LLLIGLPSGLGLAFFAMPLVASCFAYGHFSSFDLIQTQKSLITLGLGVPAFMLVKVLASGFYAQQNIKTPVKIGVIAMGVNTLLCALFIIPLAHAGLALASSMASYVNCGILVCLLIRRGIYQPSRGWGKFLLQLLVANAAVVFYLLCVSGQVSDWLGQSALIRLSLLVAHVGIALIIYIVSLGLCGLRPAQFRGKMKEF
jgi:putative peptidoglycan lipid II flippase